MQSSIAAALADQVSRALAGGADEEALIAELGLDAALAPEAVGGLGLNWTDFDQTLFALGSRASGGGVASVLAGTWLSVKLGFDITNAGVALAAHPVGSRSWVASDGEGYVKIGADGTSARREGDPALIEAVWATALSGLIAGAARGALAMAVEHVTTRQQFGRKLASFQAVQRLVAELAQETAAAQAAATLGLRLLDTDPILAAALAKGRASQAAGKAAATAHQLHGAIGVTEEHALHRLTTKLWLWRDLAGAETRWARALGDRYGAPTQASAWRGLVHDLDRTA